MATQIAFTDGVTQVEGAPLSAPRDLTDARVRDVSGVEAALEPRTPGTQTPPVPELNRTPARLGAPWIQAGAIAQKGQRYYATYPPGATDENNNPLPALQSYSSPGPDSETQIPQIKRVEQKFSGRAVANPFDSNDDPLAADWPRYIYYLLVPVNAQGEAGPFAYIGAKIPAHTEVSGISTQTDLALPSLSITTNESTRWIVVYRTPAINEQGREVSPGSQAFYEAARIGIGGEGTTSDATKRYYTTAPPHEVNFDNWTLDFPVNDYRDKQDISYFYLSTDQVVGNGGLVTGEGFVDITDWRVKFPNFYGVTVPGLTENKEYHIYQTDTNAEGEFRVFLEDRSVSPAQPVEYDTKDLPWSGTAGLPGPGEGEGEGIPVLLIPPSGSNPDQVSPTAVYQDDKNWYMDLSGEQGETYAPAGEPLDRPFNTLAASNVTVSAKSGGGADGGLEIKQTGGIERPRGEDLYYSGGLMYVAAPEWPAKTPHPIYVEKEPNNNGADLRLQYEYALPGGETLGPPLELNNVAELSVAWQGAEEAVNVFVNAGAKKYDITSASLGTQVLEVKNASDYFINQLQVGDQVTIQDGASATAEQITSKTVSSGNVDLETTGIGQYETGAVVQKRETTTLAKATDNETQPDQITVYDPNGEYTSTDSLAITIDGTEYTATGSSHSSGETSIKVLPTTSSHAKNSSVTLEFSGQVDSLGTSGANFVVAKDVEQNLTALSSGDTIDIEGGPNDGQRTLSSDPQGDTPVEGRTKIPLNTLNEESDEGQVVSGAGTSQWKLFRRITVGPYGQFTRDGSTLAFTLSAQQLTEGRAENVGAYAERLREQDAVMMSNINRPMEVTFDQFEVPAGERVRSVFRARLAEEEGLRAYRFYVGTAESIYVGRPEPQDRTVSVYAVTTAFGVGTGAQNQPLHAFVPGGALVQGTNGHLYAVSGRRTERVFPDGHVPWDEVQGLTYDPSEELVLIGTDAGIWGFDRDRKALTTHIDLSTGQLIYDEGRERALVYDGSNWRVLQWTGWPIKSIDTGADEIVLEGEFGSDFAANQRIQVPPAGVFTVSGVTASGGETTLSLSESISTTAPSRVKVYASGAVTTQPLTPKGDELSIGSVKADYEVIDYDPGNSSTYATLTQSRRHSTDTRSVDLPRGYDVYPPLRGEGLQLQVSGFDTLSELRVEGIEPAD